MSVKMAELAASLIALSTAALRLLEQMDAEHVAEGDLDFLDLVNATDRLELALEPFKPPRPTI